jgi:hypothetical protein
MSIVGARRAMILTFAISAAYGSTDANAGGCVQRDEMTFGVSLCSVTRVRR